MRRTGMLLLLAVALVFSGTLPVLAQEVTEHPLIRPYPGSTFDSRRSEYRSFGEYDFMVGTAPRDYETVTIRGEYRRLYYFLLTEDGRPNTNVSQLEYMENFKAAALASSGEITFEHRVHGLYFTLPRDDGGVTWARVQTAAGAGRTTLTIVDEKPLETSLEFGPSEMKAALDADGRVALYGILFDINKATLQQASDKQLQDVLTLLLEHPDLKLEVQGHTDSDGSAAHNLELSDRRAESVLKYLTLFGINPARLESKGYGETMPVAPNDTAENKAKNRRVELVRLE